ncbi:MAG: DUF1538 domain-containing protein [Desulfohalobiaceae bacterium]
MWEGLLAVAPIAMAVLFLQLTLVTMPWSVFLRFLLGTVFILAGLVLFMQGVRIGLLPLGESLGSELPKRSSLSFLIFFAFLLGFIVTIAEPDVQVLAKYVDYASNGLIKSYALILTVALGVGVFTGLAIIRIILGVPISYIIALGYGLVLVLSIFTPSEFLAVSFDAGGVTTGPITVPFILALGMGTTSVLGGKSPFSDGFGLVGLASIGPILGAMILGIIYS